MAFPGSIRGARMDFQQHIAVNFCHPYNRNFNRILYNFARFLPTINIDQLDENLAKLYLLSIQQDEDPHEFLSANLGTIRVWLYSSIANWVTTMVNTFDRSRVSDTAKYYRLASTHDDVEEHQYSDVDSLGYTLKLSSALKTQLTELIAMAETGNLNDPIFREQFQYKLEMTKLTLCSAHHRHESVMTEYLPNHGRDVSSIPLGETMLISEISAPLLSMIDVSTIVPQETREFYAEMEQKYCPCKLKVYGLILELLSGLRCTWSEQIWDRQLPYGYTDKKSKDRLLESSRQTRWDSWIDQLPSYRPEFAVSITTERQFVYPGKHECPARDTDSALNFLKSLVLLFN